MIKLVRFFSELMKTKDQGNQVHDKESHLDEELQRLALNKIFKQKSFSVLDGLNEYDDDFTCFSDRGELITQDMLRAAKRQLEQQEHNAKLTGEDVIEDDDRDDAEPV